MEKYGKEYINLLKINTFVNPNSFSFGNVSGIAYMSFTLFENIPLNQNAGGRYKYIKNKLNYLQLKSS